MFESSIYDNCDEVSFYIRNDFSEHFDSSNLIFNFSDLSDEENDDKNITHLIQRGDINSLRYYIKSYMDTTVNNKRPDTPAKLIINPIPKDFVPKL